MKRSFRTIFTWAFLCIFCMNSITENAAAQNPSKPLTWSIVATYTIPGKASGLAWDGTYIYFGIYGVDGNKIYKFNPSTGTYSQQCTGSFEDAFGLSYKSPNLLTINQPSNSSLPAQILEFNMSGTTVSTITLPDHYMSGVAYDAGNYWVCTYYPDPGTVYKVSSSGTVLSQFTPPNNQPWDICTQGSDLWIADYWGDMLYKVTNTGTLLESHASQSTDPAGIVYDGTYLWYCDGPLGSNSTLYKVDLQGSGTPAINVPVTSHDYGTVTIGNSATWNCEVQNTGNANLTITSIGIPAGEPISTTFVTPATISPGSSVMVPLTYTPTIAGTLNAQISINSNDPVNPTVYVTLTGNSVFSGPHININSTSHNWGDRRMHAYSKWSLQVGNNGDQSLVISALNMSDPHFIVDENVVLPITIPTLGSAQIGIWFHPEEATAYSGILSIISNDPSQNPFDITLLGNGIDVPYPIGTTLWSYMILGGYDNSPKSIIPIPDITGDTVDDVIVASEDDYIRCLNGNASVTGDVLWEKFIYSGAVYEQNGMAITGDINEDGYADLIVGTAWGDRSVYALSGKTGAQLWKHSTDDFGGGGWIYQVDAKYDYNNDGFPDVLASAGDDGNNTGPRRIYCLNGKTGAVLWTRSTGGAAFSVIGVEDFTGDGKPDVVAGSTDASQSVGKVYGLDGTNGSVKWSFTAGGSSVWALLQIDDVTGDGIKDVASGDFSGNIYFHNAVTGAQVKHLTIPNAIILRFQDIGDVTGDGHPDFLVGSSSTKAAVVNGYSGTFVWQQTLADKAWTVTNMGDLNWDGVNDAGVGTLFTDNYSYFLDGRNGSTLATVQSGDAVDAISSIPDIVGDGTRELVSGARNGLLVCLSGGYDTTSTGAPLQDWKSGILNLYPNPCREVLNISLNLTRSQDVTIVLTDPVGRVLFRQTYHDQTEGMSTIRINFGQGAQGVVPAGLVLVKIEAESGVFNGKLIFE